MLVNQLVQLFQQFLLLKNLDVHQLDKVLSECDLYRHIKLADIVNLPEINMQNFVNICKFVEYYQLQTINEFLENIRFHIFNKNQKVITYVRQLSLSMQDRIYDHECLPEMKCYYNLNKHDSPHNNIKHISCYKFLNQKKDICYDINRASEKGNLELVKYLLKNGEECTTRAIILASKNGHLEVVKYLYEDQYLGWFDAVDYACENDHLDIVKYFSEVVRLDYIDVVNKASRYGSLNIVKYLLEVLKKDCTTNAIDWASYHGHLEMVKYLVKDQNKHCTVCAINWASMNGHFDVVEYLFENGKKCTKDAINWASESGHLKIVKYLIEKQNQKYTQQTKDIAQANVLEYLLTKPDSFIA